MDLCLSGDGYRAMLFHLGAVWRLNELGLLRKLVRISKVGIGASFLSPPSLGCRRDGENHDVNYAR
jgi:hypothetical protein